MNLILIRNPISPRLLLYRNHNPLEDLEEGSLLPLPLLRHHDTGKELTRQSTPTRFLQPHLSLP